MSQERNGGGLEKKIPTVYFKEVVEMKLDSGARDMRVARHIPKKHVLMIVIGISRGHAGALAGMARN